MCGISQKVHDAFQVLDELNHESSMSLRNWTGKPLVEERGEIKDHYQSLAKDITARDQQRSPVPGAGKKSKDKGKEKGRGKGAKRQFQFKNWSDQDVRNEHLRVGQELDRMTFNLQEGKLTSGQELTRVYRTLPMFVGVVLTGFGGDWITQGSCYICGIPNGTARCCRCQCGICQEHKVSCSVGSARRLGGRRS